MKKITWEKIVSFTRYKYSVILILLAIVIFGTVLRLYHLGVNPFVADEFIDINSSYGYVKTHIWQAWDFNQNIASNIDIFAPRDERAWAYKWQVAQLLKFFPLSEATSRLASVGWGIASIFIIYWVARYFTKRKAIGLLSAFLFAISATAIAFDRKLRMYAMFYPIYLLLSLFLYQFFEENYKGKIRLVSFFYQKLKVNIVYLVPLAVTAIISLSIQLLTINIVPVFLVYALIQAIILAKKKQFINKYSIILLVAIISGIVMYAITPQTVLFYSGALKFFINNQGYFIKILQDYSNYFFALILLVSGAYALYKQKLSKEAFWLSTSFFVPLLLAAFMWRRAQGIQYLFFLQSFVIILIAAGIYFWAKFFSTNLQKFSRRAFGITILITLLILPDYGYFFRNDTTYRRDNTQVADYRKVFTYVRKNFPTNGILITRNFRNYYLNNAKINIFDFGGERATSKLSLEQIQTLHTQNTAGWVVLFDNDSDFIAKDALNYIKQNFIKIDTSQIRGASEAYKW